MDLFEKAVRIKVRYESSKGLITTEDLWDLPLTSTRNAPNLNDIAKGLNRELKASGEEDFVTPSRTNETLQLKFEIVKHVIATRLAENAAVAEAADKQRKKERLLELIARKQDQELEGKPLEDLQKMVAEL